VRAAIASVTAAAGEGAAAGVAGRGAALLAHHFIRLGFRPAWEEVAGAPGVLERLGAELDRAPAPDGGVTLTIPLA
jgi:hypothetical protein